MGCKTGGDIGGNVGLTLVNTIVTFRTTNGTGSANLAGRRRSWRRRGALSNIENDFDKNPRLETVVGFLFAMTSSHNPESYEQNN